MPGLQHFEAKTLCELKYYPKHMLVDEVKIQVAAGDGGNGVAAFSKTKMNLGPTGANGGNGGDLYLEGIENIGALKQFRYKKDFKAEDGEIGTTRLRDGAGGNDLILKVPVGTVVHNLTKGTDLEIKKIGQKEKIVAGGRGGRGNFLFRSPSNTTPKEFELGKPGKKATLRLELKLIADAGFVGLPNVGKSTLLNILTNAKSRVANYHFTTLEPHLGAYYELILADIPGLIEGASEGKGLGIKFLRHVERTEILFHFVSCESPDPQKDYKTIRKELGAYNKELLNKKEFVFLTKTDLVTPKQVKEKLAQLKKIKVSATPISSIDDDSIKKVQKILNKIKEKKYETS
jgi:GTPase